VRCFAISVSYDYQIPPSSNMYLWQDGEGGRAETKAG
jgi:hypothetical protein